jgi:ribosomal protein S18 acetylase RimI-like enzyme
VNESDSFVVRPSSFVNAVGCVFYEQREDYVYLGRLAVLPTYRRRGIAHTLIGYVEERARSAGLARVRLGVRTALPQMRASYERMGYRLIEERAHPGYEQPTYVILERDVST